MPSPLVTEIRTLLNNHQSIVDDPAAPLKQITFGGNNQAYRYDKNGEVFFVKRYFSHPTDNRDRQGNELRFVTFLSAHGVSCIPKIIDFDSTYKITVFQFIPGTKLTPQAILDEDIYQLVQFYKQINEYRRNTTAQSIQIASESFFSKEEHLDCVSERVSRLEAIDAKDAISEQAARFASKEVIPVWHSIRKTISSLAAKKSGLWSELQNNIAARCLSPSDFGFHNALRNPEGKLIFFDFEYSGWDDPAKTVCDLTWQVACPISTKHTDLFFEQTAKDFGDYEALNERVQILLPLFGIKWVCIVLNHFSRTDKQRKEFSSAQPISPAILEDQLQKARDILLSLKRNYPELQ